MQSVPWHTSWVYTPLTPGLAHQRWRPTGPGKGRTQRKVYKLTCGLSSCSPLEGSGQPQEATAAVAGNGSGMRSPVSCSPARFCRPFRRMFPVLWHRTGVGLVVRTERCRAVSYDGVSSQLRLTCVRLAGAVVQVAMERYCVRHRTTLKVQGGSDGLFLPVHSTAFLENQWGVDVSGEGSLHPSPLTCGRGSSTSVVHGSDKETEEQNPTKGAPRSTRASLLRALGLTSC